MLAERFGKACDCVIKTVHHRDPHRAGTAWRLSPDQQRAQVRDMRLAPGEVPDVSRKLRRARNPLRRLTSRIGRRDQVYLNNRPTS